MPILLVSELLSARSDLVALAELFTDSIEHPANLCEWMSPLGLTVAKHKIYDRFSIFFDLPMIDLSSPTSQTLLAKLRTDTPDDGAWRDFVDQYGTRIYHWCRARGLQTADAEDVTQNVLIRLTKALTKFEYDSSMSFRAWLRTVTENLVIDFLRERSRHSRDGRLPNAMNRINEAEATQDLLARLDDLFDLEILEEAKSRIRVRVSSERWKAWQLMAEESLSAKEVSRIIGMEVATVYTARSQIQKMIHEEVRRLEL